MCRLFSSISKEPISISHWFFDAQPHPFKEFSERKINGGPHDDGWGVAWTIDGKWEIFKEGKREKYDFSRINGLESRLFIAHLRKASVGRKTTANAHPFQYKNWIFAHNGGTDKEKLFECLNGTFRNAIQSETDSEIFFLLIMQFYEETKDLVAALRRTVSRIKTMEYRGLNFLLSDGQNMYAYRDVSPKHIDLCDYYSLYYLQENDNVIFSSDPLDNDKSWKSIGLGELIEVNRNLDLTSHTII